MARSSRIPAVLCLGALLALTACDGPTAPEEAALEPPEPAFLIGDSPLIVFDPSGPDVEVTLEVNRGLTEVKIEDKFRVQASVSWWDDVLTEPGFIGKAEVQLVGTKDTNLRGGGTVSIAVCIDIPAPVWDAIVDADDSATGGDNPQLHVLSELVLTDATGMEHVLKSLDVTRTIDPKGDG